MLILSNTTDKIEVVLSATVSTNELQCMVSWRDRTSTTFVAGRNITNTNSITDVDITGSPVASTQRIIDHINIYNSDTSTANVTVKYDANGTEYILFSTALLKGEILEYSEGKGWVVFNAIGSQKVSLFNGVNTTSSRMAVAVLPSDVVNNNSTANTMQNVTGLSFPVEVGRYYFKFLIRYSSAATTTGSRWSVAFANGAAGSLQYKSEYTLTATSRTINFGDALYHTTSLKGIHICDSKFGFGCYHSFLEEAITDKGLSAINDLDNECSKQFSKGGSCQHGIGHGILSYLGDDKLSQALTLCTTLKSKKTFSHIS